MTIRQLLEKLLDFFDIFGLAEIGKIIARTNRILPGASYNLLFNIVLVVLWVCLTIFSFIPGADDLARARLPALAFVLLEIFLCFGYVVIENLKSLSS